MNEEGVLDIQLMMPAVKIAGKESDNPYIEFRVSSPYLWGWCICLTDTSSKVFGLERRGPVIVSICQAGLSASQTARTWIPGSQMVDVTVSESGANEGTH